MISLSKHQVDYIFSLLEEKGIDFGPVKEELLDHICCMVEQQMCMGLSFHLAVEDSFSCFQESELLHLQNQSIHFLNRKKRIMKITSFFALGLLLCFSTVWYFFSEPPSINPLKGDFEVTSGFGERLHPVQKKLKMHKGIDLKAPVGTPVVATSDGVVEKVIDRASGYRKHIVIRHDDEYSTLYAQLSRMDVRVGEEVKKGQVIGAVGNSGASTGPHLHYEVIRNGKNIDPEDFITP